MFTASGGLTLNGDHLDLSFHDKDSWPKLTPLGSLKSYSIMLGDPTAGPEILLGLTSVVAGEDLDWKNVVDPVHYHGTDQFRVLVDGDWVVAGRPLPYGGYNFQESGWTYQEHPANGAAWTAYVMGDRRGSPATIRRKVADRDKAQEDELFGIPVYNGGDYPHPAGSRGIAAINTTAGQCERGYMFGQIAELSPAQKEPALTGLLGDETVGPAVHILKTESGKTAMPACTYATELFLVVVRGTCQIGEATYQRGDMRVQRAGAQIPAIIAGSAGVEAVLVVADRRSHPTFASEEAPLGWTANVEKLRSTLSAAPGGPVELRT